MSNTRYAFTRGADPDSIWDTAESVRAREDALKLSLARVLNELEGESLRGMNRVAVAMLAAQLLSQGLARHVRSRSYANRNELMADMQVFLEGAIFGSPTEPVLNSLHVSLLRELKDQNEFTYEQLLQLIKDDGRGLLFSGYFSSANFTVNASSDYLYDNDEQSDDGSDHDTEKERLVDVAFTKEQLFDFIKELLTPEILVNFEKIINSQPESSVLETRLNSENDVKVALLRRVMNTKTTNSYSLSSSRFPILEKMLADRLARLEKEKSIINRPSKEEIADAQTAELAIQLGRYLYPKLNETWCKPKDAASGADGHVDQMVESIVNKIAQRKGIAVSGNDTVVLKFSSITAGDIPDYLTIEIVLEIATKWMIRKFMADQIADQVAKKMASRAESGRAALSSVEFSTIVDALTEQQRMLLAGRVEKILHVYYRLSEGEQGQPPAAKTEEIATLIDKKLEPNWFDSEAEEEKSAPPSVSRDRAERATRFLESLLTVSTGSVSHSAASSYMFTEPSQHETNTNSSVTRRRSQFPGVPREEKSLNKKGH